MKLEIQQYNKNVMVVPMKNKNELALALENTKLRDYPQEVRTKNTLSIVLWLLDLLGVKGDDATQSHHITASNFINETLLNYTYQEIKLAFQKYVSGEYNEPNGNPMLVTQQLNAVIIGKVMAAYGSLKKRELDSYRRERYKLLNKPKEMTEEEKEMLVYIGITDCFKYYQYNKRIEAGKGYVYDYFYEKGKLPKHTPEFREAIKEKALNELQTEIKSGGITSQIKEALKSIQPSTIAVKCKEIILRDYFDYLIENKIDIKTQI